MGYRIFLYGGGDPQGIHGSFRRAFEHLGHEVSTFSKDEASARLDFWLTNRLLHRLTFRSKFARRVGASGWNNYIVQEARQNKPDFMFILQGVFLMPETIRRLRDLGVRVFLFHPDNPYERTEPEAEANIPEVDCYFIWSESLGEKISDDGAKRVEYLPFAWDPQVFPGPGESFEHSDECEFDITFIGNWSSTREEILTPVAEQFDLHLWGRDYWKYRTKPFSPLAESWHGRPLSSRESADVMRRSKIVLNPLRDQNLPDGLNMRTFEVPGSGGFSLSTRTPGATEIFPEGEAAAYFDGTSELLRTIENYLSKPEQRELVARRGHRITRDGHTYATRASEIIRVFENL